MKFDIVTRLRNPPFGTETSERNIMFTAADEIELLRSRIAELEVDRNEALNAAVDSSEIAGEACIKAHDATARAERLESLIRPIAPLAVMGDEKSDPRWKDAPKGDEDIIQVSISLGQLRAMRAALSEGGDDAGA